MNNLQWLMKWYEHNPSFNGPRVSVFTLDNPGWGVNINLKNTRLILKPFCEYQQYESDQNWILCFMDTDYFKGRGDTARLEEMLKIFREWVES